jgi:hypothetical protein
MIFDFTPDPKVLLALTRTPMQPLDALCELIDNAIDSFSIAKIQGIVIDNPLILIDLPTKKQLTTGTGVLRIRDNGPGMNASDAEKAIKVEKQLAAYEKEKIELTHKNELHKMELAKARSLEQLAIDAKIEEESRAAEEARVQAKADMQKLLDAIHTAELERNKLADAAAIETEQKLAAVEKAKQEAYAETVKTIMESVDESLVAALTANANADMLAAVTKSIAPYAMAKGETVADFTNTLLRGTTLEGVVDNLTKVKIED